MTTRAHCSNGKAVNGKTATVAEAKAFLEDAEARLFDLGKKAQRAAWVQENFITEDTEQIAADAGSN